MTLKPSPIFCLFGPTASGKTALALALCDRLPFDIISVDSAMVYRGMDIGTAKPDAATLAQVPHRLIDICEATAPYSAAQFCQDAQREIHAIQEAGRLPLLVGGTMLYFKALQQGLSALPQADKALRAELAQSLAEQGLEALYQQLATIDPDSAQRIGPTDPQRILRALEIYLTTGVPMSALLTRARQDHAAAAPFVNLALMPTDRTRLHDQIAARFQSMLTEGLVAEVQTFYDCPAVDADLPAMRAVGYRQVYAYLAGELSADVMTEQAIAATRQLAKRQMTWIRHWPQMESFDSADPQLLSAVLRCIAEKMPSNS